MAGGIGSNWNIHTYFEGALLLVGVNTQDVFALFKLAVSIRHKEALAKGFDISRVE